MRFRYYPLEVGGLKTCPIKSNRVLRSSISLGCFLCSLFWFSHWTGDQNIPRKQPSMSVVSSIYQLRTAPKSVISLPLKRPGWSSKVPKVSWCFTTPRGDPVLSLTWLKGYRYSPKCYINVATASTVSVYPAQFPHSLFLLLKGIPQIRVRIYKTPMQAHNNKAIKASNWKQEWSNPKVHLTY